MTKMRHIAQDPHEALKDLEKELGAKPGELLEEMDAVGAPGDDWSQHLPFRAAVSYYDDRKVEAQYKEHVEECHYCQSLLETLHSIFAIGATTEI
jgi:hypothetical protein